MKENPKSYTLWFHRQWTILKGLEIEKYMSDEQLKEAKGGILINEIGLCDKMLGSDERNFHCWNYRSWIITQKLEQILKVQEVRKDTQTLEEAKRL